MSRSPRPINFTAITAGQVEEAAEQAAEVPSIVAANEYKIKKDFEPEYIPLENDMLTPTATVKVNTLIEFIRRDQVQPGTDAEQRRKFELAQADTLVGASGTEQQLVQLVEALRRFLTQASDPQAATADVVTAPVQEEGIQRGKRLLANIFPSTTKRDDFASRMLEAYLKKYEIPSIDSRIKETFSRWTARQESAQRRRQREQFIADIFKPELETHFKVEWNDKDFISVFHIFKDDVWKTSKGTQQAPAQNTSTSQVVPDPGAGTTDDSA